MDSVKKQIKITVSFWAVAVFGAAICIDRAAVLILLCALAHELGHLFACLILNMDIEEFNLTVLGFGIVKKQAKAQNELLITAAGPLTGLLLTSAAYILGYQHIAAVSLILSAVNLIPVPPLDGDRLLREILPLRVVFLINVIAAAALFGFGLYVAIKYINFTLMLFSLIMIWCLFGKYTQGISAKMFRNLRLNF